MFFGAKYAMILCSKMKAGVAFHCTPALTWLFRKEIKKNDYPHIGAIDPEKGLRSVTVGRNDLRRLQMMTIALWMSAPTVFVGDPSRVDILIAIYPRVLRTPRLLSGDAFSVLITWLRIIIFNDY